jgi:hypothetical protein
MLASVVIVAVSLSPKQVFAFRHKKRRNTKNEKDYGVNETTDRRDFFDHTGRTQVPVQ